MKRIFQSKFWFLVGILMIFGCNSVKNSRKYLKKTSETVSVDKKVDSINGTQAELETKVLALFDKNCFSCHGENGANSGSIGNVKNISSLKEQGLVKIGSPADESKLYLRMIDKTQPMPPQGVLPDQDLLLVKTWIETKPEVRNLIDYDSVYKMIEKDFNDFSAEEKVDIRYFHLINMHNSGAPEESIEQTRKALSKMFNMLSTAEEISKPVPLDDENLVYRINLKVFDLHRPETLYTFMLKKTYGGLTNEEIEKWFPDPEDKKVENYYGGRYKEIFEDKKSLSKFLKPEHVYEGGLPVANHPILKKMAMQMREAGQKNSELSLKTYGLVSDEEKADTRKCQLEIEPEGISCSNPLPLVRADWFVSQVSGNMQMRLYYHASGMDDDTVSLDAALGIDDQEGSMLDNDPDFDRNIIPEEDRIIRAGFNNSGVSINHRFFERIPLAYTPGKPLWRAFEFKDKLKSGYESHDVFEFPAGPIFEIGGNGEAGYECINLMTPRYTELENGEKARTLALMDHGVLYPSKLPDNEVPSIVQELQKLRPSATSEVPTTEAYAALLDDFKGAYGHEDFFNWKADDYISTYGALPLIEDSENPFNGIRMRKCEVEDDNPVAFRHEKLEYLFLKRNGMQAFVNVGLHAEHIDYGIPNQRALENKEALLIPAHDKEDVIVVAAPLSCLSCHAQGFIEKEDQVAKYVSESVRPEKVTDVDFWTRVKAKIKEYHVPFDKLKSQMDKDNQVFRDALKKTGVNYKDPEPIVDTYRNWAIPGLTKNQVAVELAVTMSDLDRYITQNQKVRYLLREFKIDGAKMKRAEFEKAYRPLMCEIHKSCKEIGPESIIPSQ